MKHLALIAATALVFYGASPAAAHGSPPATHILPLPGTSVAVTSVSSACTAPAAVDGEAYWEMPSIAAEQDAGGIVQVRIDLNATGALTNEGVFASSGNLFLDDAALRSARMTKFKPEVANCEHVGGSYLYEVDF